jgi:hypothetical protein
MASPFLIIGGIIMKKIGLLLAVSCVIIISIFAWVKNDKLIDGHYESLTITTMDNNTVEVINDKDEIEKIINHINNSPRKFKYDSGMTYDYMPLGLLTFENGNERVQLAFIMSKGNVITKYWEIKTEFRFGKDIN